MEITYRIIGTDGQQYGPVGLEQLKAWVREGRVTPQTQVARSDANAWLTAAQFTELGLSSPARPVMAPAGVESMLTRQLKSSADWFFWIAALSLVNSILEISRAGIRFIVDLGITRWGGYQLGGGSLALGFALLVAGIFAGFGIFARKGHGWSFIVGGVLYLFDALICCYLTDWLAVAFHAYALFWIFKGFQANQRLNALRRAGGAQPG